MTDKRTSSIKAKEYPLGSGGDFVHSPDFPEPLKIAVGDMPVDNVGISWEVIPGVEAYQTKIRVPNNRIEKVQSLRRGGYKRGLTLTMSAWDVVRNKKEEIQIHNVFLLPSEPVSDVYYEVPLVSCMYWYRYFTWTKRYNMRRVANDFETVDSQGLYTFRKDRYLGYSLNGNKPWTALEILVDVLTGINTIYGIDWFDVGSVKNIKDNFFVPDEREYIRVPATNVINELLTMSYCGIRCDIDGKIRLYSYESEPFAGIDKGKPIQQDDTALVDYSSKRASLLSVGFVPFKEVWLQTDPNEEQGFGATAVVQQRKGVGFPYIYNVMPVPTNISKEAVNAAWGRIDSVALGEFGEALRTNGVVRGTWLPIRTAIEFRAEQDKIDAQTDQFAVPMIPINGSAPNKFAFGGGEPIITRAYYAGLLEMFYGLSKQGAPVFYNVTRMRWCNAIRQHLYKTYRIWPEYMNQIVSWEPVRAGFIDPVYRQYLNSPVYTEYAVMPNAFPPPDLLPLGGEQVAGQNYDDYSLITTTMGKFFGRVPKLGKFANDKVAELFGDDLNVIRVSPFRVDVVDKELGIFRLSPEEDLEGIAARIEPAQVENLDKLLIGPTGSILDGNMWLKNRKKIKLIVSVIPANPNNDGLLYTEEIKPESLGHKPGTAPVHKIVCSKEMARFDVLNAEPRNIGTIRDIARAESITYYTSYRDRTFGIVTYQGFATGAELTGFQRGITYVAGSGGLFTYQDFTENPEPMPFFTLVNHDSRKLLYRAIWERK